ncbi:MAG: hypothetical protein AMXMBFR84_23980 [Candidatus Hydrogenedentota bacterium]
MSKGSKPEKTALEERLEAEAAAEQAVAMNADAAGEELPVEAEAEAIEAEMAAILSERDTLHDQLLRLRADFDNYRKRMLRETERIRKTAAESLIADLLPVVDNLDLALKHKDDTSSAVVEGVEMVFKNFMGVLMRHGLESIPTDGAPFDPAVHDAVMQQASDDVPAGNVLQEFQRGFRMGELVLRPARVVVSTGPSLQNGAATEQTQQTDEARRNAGSDGTA